jgi:hypothetical protein
MSEDNSGQNPEWRDRQWKEEVKDNLNQERRVRRRRPHLPGLFPGLVLILLGVTFFLSMQHWFSWGEWWQYFLVGLGVIFIIDAIVQYAYSEYPHPGFGRFITGIILIIVGVAFIFGFEKWWPLILIAVGLGIVAGAVFRRR